MKWRAMVTVVASAVIGALATVMSLGLALPLFGTVSATDGLCNTILAQAADAGAGSIEVEDPTGCEYLDWIVINQGGDEYTIPTEECQQLHDPSGTTLLLVGTLVHAHSAGETVVGVAECPTPEPTESPTPKPTETPAPEPTEVPLPPETPMPSAPGQMHYCPEAGKWSIATWRGQDGMPIADALASCPQQVDAAYRIDPGTQSWTRYFRGRPEITNLEMLDEGQGVIALGAGLAAASTASDEPLRAMANGMLGCPQAGKWAISVWSGPDGTDTDQALAACGAEAVAAAYYLDPQTQGWLRWFAGRPDISNLVTLNTMQGVIALGAVGPATPTPTPMPIAEAGGFDGFRSFAQLIEAALEGEDAQFFVERARLTELTCTGEEFPLPCAGQPAGTTLSGISSGAWQSDASALLSPEEYELWLKDYFSTALGDLSDDYGSGSLTLYALAHSKAEGNEIFRAISTSIVDRYPSGTPIGQNEREAHVFNFEFENGRWQFTGEIVALTSVTSPDWLSGECSNCYDRWERWTGATQ